MPSELPRLPVRVSPGLRELIAQAGPVGPATRALLILGARAAGLDVAPVVHEALALLGRPGLPPSVRAALLELAGEPVAGPPRAAPRGASGGATNDTQGGATIGATDDTFVPMPPAGGLLEDLLADVGLEV